MPIFEYLCRECKHSFETIVMGSKTPKCPKCGGKKLEQQLSRFAVAGSGEKSSAMAKSGGGACGSCGDPRGPGACSLD
jgi:putative FmdB family regulatory protein